MNEEKNEAIETVAEPPVNGYYVKLLSKEIYFFRRALHDKKELNPDQAYTLKANVKILTFLTKKYRSMFRRECVGTN